MFIEGEGTVSTVLFSASNTATHDTKLEPYRARGRMSNRSPLNLDDYIFTLDPAGYTGNVNNYKAAGRIRFLADGSFSSASAPGRIEFHTTPVGSLFPVNRMVIKNNGNVGLGTENPQVPLHVETPLFGGFVIKNGKGNPDVTLRSGAMSIAPWKDSLYITTNCYVNNNSICVHDSWSGSATKNGKLVISARDGAYWSASTNVPVTGFWDIDYIPLWDVHGILAGHSTRKAKENLTRLNPDEILQQIDQLEVSRWNYKVDDKSVTHIGPVAEDFHRIFKTGDSEKSIALIDSSGVSLAGVKALLEKITMQQQQIEKFQAEMEELKSRLNK